MTLSIDGFNFIWAKLGYLDEEQTNEVHFLTENGGSFYWTKIGHPWWNDYVNSNLYPPRPHQASQYHREWDDVNNAWKVDYSYFTPNMKDEIKVRRDAALEELLATHEFESEVLGLRPNTRTLEAVGRKSLVAPIKNDAGFTVNYKFASFTPVDANDSGYRTVTTAFLQEIYAKLDAANQKAFDAEKHVLETHAATPYEFIQDALDDFDEYLNS